MWSRSPPGCQVGHGVLPVACNGNLGCMICTACRDPHSGKIALAAHAVCFGQLILIKHGAGCVDVGCLRLI